jgi:hypothetical protein
MAPINKSIIIPLQFLLSILLFLIQIKNLKYKSFKLFNYVVFFYIYYIILCLFSSELITSFNYLFKFLIPFIYILVGYSIVNSKEALIYFLEKGWLINSYFTIYIILMNITNTGLPFYENGILVGFYSLNGIYLPTFIIIANLFLFKHYKNSKSKWLNLVFSITSTLILIIILKRTLLILIILAAFFYVITNFSFKKIIRILIPVIITFLSISYLYQDELQTAIESRKSRFSEEYKITEEGRFTENIFLYNVLKKDALKLIFGSGEIFNDRSTLTELRVYEDEREAHNSFIRIFWNGGILGIITFLVFYFKQFFYFFKFYLSVKKFPQINRDILFFLMLFIVLRFINDFSSGITYLNYNAWSYFIIGAGFSIVQSFKNNKNVRNSWYN